MSPYATLLGLSVEADGEGGAVFVMPFGDDVLGRPGFVHGGAIAGLMEVAGTAALDAALGHGHGVAIEPITCSVEFLRGGRDKPTRAGAVVERLGTRIANVRATAWQDDPAAPIAAARLIYRLSRG